MRLLLLITCDLVLVLVGGVLGGLGGIHHLCSHSLGVGQEPAGRPGLEVPAGLAGACIVDSAPHVRGDVEVERSCVEVAFFNTPGM